MNELKYIANITQVLKENEAMNSLLIERDEEIEKLKKEVARLKASLRKEKS